VTSKYDQYWAARLSEIRDALGRAAKGFPATVSTPGLPDLGDRQSWYGLAKVRAHEMTRSSMAHATSLGRTIAASGICAQWPRDTFRLVINDAGDALTITTSHHDSLTGETARHGPGHRPQAALAPDSASAPAARTVPAPPVTAEMKAGRARSGEFYQLLAELASLEGGARRLRDCRADDFPSGGVYFFFEDGEVRGDGSSRVIRVGTHALTATSKATLWDRLRQHRGHLAGRNPGSGNHRASVFRRHIGAALIQRDGQPPELLASWLDRNGPHPGRASQETAVEMAVSRLIGAMPVLWLSVPAPSTRGYLERNSIALTSQLAVGEDPPSLGWLGHHAIPSQIRQSGLWNVEHVTSLSHPDFLPILEQLVQQR
jgi:hypothetical protein